MSKIALCVFVKTPFLSPVKTRLAASIGKATAAEFYERSVKATESVLLTYKQGHEKEIDIFWAVAESDPVVINYWKTFPIIFQGSGGLGERLGSVYNQLITRYDFVCFMGADSPHIALPVFEKFFKAVKSRSSAFVMAETDDGGFYLFSGSKILPKEAWLNVEYSTEKTALQLNDNLRKFGDIQNFQTNFDVDTIQDFEKLAYLNDDETCDFVREQLDLKEWCLFMVDQGVNNMATTAFPNNVFKLTDKLGSREVRSPMNYSDSYIFRGRSGRRI